MFIHLFRFFVIADVLVLEQSIMELLIYGTFLVLAIVAYVSRQFANSGDEKKINVSNTTFKR